jgi:Tfp pilus assembly protein PilN
VNRINLLPDRVLARQRRGRLLKAATAVAVCALTVGAAWGATVYRQVRDLSGQVAAAQVRLNQEQQRAAGLAQMTAESNALRTLLAQGEQLADPVELPGVLTLLTHLLPESVALSRVSIEVPPADVGSRLKATRGAPQPRTTHLLLEGLATSDLDLARAVGALSAQKAFTNVKLSRSKPVTSGGLTRYAFELTIDVPPAASAPDAGPTSGKGSNG